jgi:polyhydroxybutyrate depolymerase
MLLHGGTASGARIAEQTNLAAYVDRLGFIAVFPDSESSEWNDGRDTSRSARDDVGFLVALVRDLVARWGADPARVFVGGASSGGMMTQRLACEASNVFAAYAVVVANLPAALAGTCRPSRRTPIVFFESTADTFMPWAGGEVKRGRFRGVGGQVLSVPQTIDFWSRMDGCSTSQTQDLPSQVNDGTHVRVHRFDGCGLLFYEIQGGGHTWPGGTPPGAFIQRFVGNTTRNVNATAVMLDFFRTHGLY